MIVNINGEAGISKGTFKDIDVSLDIQSQEKLLYLLSQGQYETPIHSSIREVLANALDSHIEAGINSLEKPVIVDLDYYKFWVQDFGVGIDDARMEIISKFGASTKEQSAEQFGCWGIGFFTPLSTSLRKFTCDSAKDGIKRSWLIQKNGSKTQILKINEEPSDEENNTIITIPINDRRSWENALEETVPYFKGVYYPSHSNLNSRVLFEGKNFIIDSHSSVRRFHIVLDQVVYNIDPIDLELPNNEFPIGIKFGLNEGLIPTPSREKIILDDNSIEKIRQRVSDALVELMEYSDTTFKDYLYYVHFFDKNNITFKFGEFSIKLSRKIINSFSKTLNLEFKSNMVLNPVLDQLNQIKLANTWVAVFPCVTKFNSYYQRFESINYNYHTLTIFKEVVLLDIPLTTRHKEFFKQRGKETSFLKHNPITSLKGRSSFFSFLDLSVIPKKNWREIITEFRKEEQKILNNWKKLSDFKDEMDVYFSSKKKTVSKITNVREEVVLRLPIDEASTTYNFKLIPTGFKVDQIPKDKLYIYSSDRTEIDQLLDLMRNRPNISPTQIIEKDIPKIQHLSNFMDFQTFKNGKTRFSKNWVTAYIIKKQIKENKALTNVFDYSASWRNPGLCIQNSTIFKRGEQYKLKSSPLLENISNVYKFVDKWYKSDVDETFVKSVVDTYISLGLINKPVLDEFEYIKSQILKYEKIYAKVDFGRDIVYMFDQWYIANKQKEFYKKKVKKCK